MLTVYVAGLIYFDGCNQPERHMFAPDGRTGNPRHDASLWIAADLIDEEATEWWDSRQPPREIAGVSIVEFRIPEPAEIRFPDDGTPGGECGDLENKLSKLKRKKKDGTEENYEINPATAKTIAAVTIRRGDIFPRRFKEMSLVEWTIPNPSTFAITATLKDNDSESRTITLRPSAGAAEVVFANTHDLFAVDKTADLGDDHDIELFKKLNPTSEATLVSVKARGSAGRPTTDHPLFNSLRDIKYAGGDPPNCCGT